MKQLSSESGVTRMNAGFAFGLRRPEVRHRFLDSLRPEATDLPLDISEWDIVAELDPGMVDWQEAGR